MTFVTSDRRPRVLVIEDDTGVARMLRFSLRNAGFDTSEAATEGEALRILGEEPPDAAVLDLQLPNGQGRAVLDWLRELDRLAGESLAWVVISALDGEEAIRLYGPLGGRFLPKPFDPGELITMLRTLLSLKE